MQVGRQAKRVEWSRHGGSQVSRKQSRTALETSEDEPTVIQALEQEQKHLILSESKTVGGGDIPPNF